MRKIIVLSALLLCGCLQPALAQTATYFDGAGNYRGNSVQMGNQRTYFGADGQYLGNSSQLGNSTIYLNGAGEYVGTEMRSGYGRSDD